MFYNELMSDFEMDEKDFEADSWSLAVDSSFLQQHKKEVMKKQDVIYGTPRARWSPCPFLVNQGMPTALLPCVFSLSPTCRDTLISSLTSMSPAGTSLSLCTYFLVLLGFFYFLFKR